MIKNLKIILAICSLNAGLFAFNNNKTIEPSFSLSKYNKGPISKEYKFSLKTNLLNIESYDLVGKVTGTKFRYRNADVRRDLEIGGKLNTSILEGSVKGFVSLIYGVRKHPHSISSDSFTFGTGFKQKLYGNDGYVGFDFYFTKFSSNFANKSFHVLQISPNLSLFSKTPLDEVPVNFLFKINHIELSKDNILNKKSYTSFIFQAKKKLENVLTTVYVEAGKTAFNIEEDGLSLDSRKVEKKFEIGLKLRYHIDENNLLRVGYSYSKVGFNNFGNTYVNKGTITYIYKY